MLKDGFSEDKLDTIYFLSKFLFQTCSSAIIYSLFVLLFSKHFTTLRGSQKISSLHQGPRRKKISSIYTHRDSKFPNFVHNVFSFQFFHAKSHCERMLYNQGQLRNVGAENRIIIKHFVTFDLDPVKQADSKAVFPNLLKLQST